jgi:deoxyribonuclease-1
MEADLYNLFPEIGELNGLRSNYSMADFAPSDLRPGAITFGGCPAIIQDRKFRPADSARGVVARTYLYMDQAYPGRGIISRKNRKLFEAWNRLHPVTDWECARAKKIEAVQGNPNPVMKAACNY